MAGGLAASAAPSGTVARKAYEHLRDQILADLHAAMPVDAVLLNLHGAMVADGYDDCEGDLLFGIRQTVGPRVAIGAELDPQLPYDGADDADRDGPDLLQGDAYTGVPYKRILRPRWPIDRHVFDDWPPAGA